MMVSPYSIPITLAPNRSVISHSWSLRELNPSFRNSTTSYKPHLRRMRESNPHNESPSSPLSKRISPLNYDPPKKLGGLIPNFYSHIRVIFYYYFCPMKGFKITHPRWPKLHFIPIIHPDIH